MFGRISDAVINIPSQNVSIQERPNFLRGQNCPWWGITMLEGPESEPLLIVADFVKLAGCSDPSVKRKIKRWTEVTETLNSR